jgi:hypothetical protein
MHFRHPRAEPGASRTAPPRDHSADDSNRSPLARTPADFSHIQGWGADLDHKDRPAHPKERTPARLSGVHWTRPDDQPVEVAVYHSTERAGITPLFGSSVPPSGVSGLLRRYAYRLSENDLRHWLLLLFADRVNVVEGIVQDLARGRVPNLYAEMGGRAELRHNPAGLARKALVGAALVGIGVYLLRRRGRR